MTVINPSSISGITSITMPSGDGNVLTIHTNDGTERFRIDSSGNVKVGSAATISQDGDVFFTGVCTATTLTGAASGLTGTLPAISGANLTNLPAANVTGTLPAISGANLTNLTAGNLTGALPAISGANLTGIAATDNVRTGILDVAGIATFRDTVNVPNLNGGQLAGRRNLVINGAMTVAQRGTSSTTNGYGSVDRFKCLSGGTDELPTHAQVDVTAATTPYTLGFRKALKITNGNQTSGAGSSDYILVRSQIEAQDIANSGWNYKSTSSFITLSFWIKSSVAQNFHGHIRAHDTTSYNYPFETGSLSADTWTKVTKTIPGNSNLTFDNNTEAGLGINIAAFFGTDYTSGVSNNEWINYASADLTPDQTSTWYTTNDATLEITGVQLEVGSQATPFEHPSFHHDYLECARYYIQMNRIPVMTNRTAGYVSTTSRLNPVPMRATPTVAASGTITLNVFFYGGTAPTSTTAPGFQNSGDSGAPYGGDYFILNFSGFSTGTFQTNEFGEVYGATFSLSAEL